MIASHGNQLIAQVALDVERLAGGARHRTLDLAAEAVRIDEDGHRQHGQQGEQHEPARGSLPPTSLFAPRRSAASFVVINVSESRGMTHRVRARILAMRVLAPCSGNACTRVMRETAAARVTH